MTDDMITEKSEIIGEAITDEVSDSTSANDAILVENEDITSKDTPKEPNGALEAIPSPDALILSLNEKISALEAELLTYKANAERQQIIAEQINEFNELFPSIAIKSVPDEVWESVKSGNSLAAAYSVYEKRITEAARKIELINKRNASAAAGTAGNGSPREFFSADEVRKMSPAEVRANYAGIRRSMEKWN